jgi:hypothetical protein
MKSFFLFYSCVGFAGLLFFIPAHAHASAVITKTDPQSLKIGDYLTIEGSGFKSQQGQYDFICFSDTNTCMGKTNSSVQSWSDTRIVLKLPAGALSGQIFLVLEESVRTCANEFICYDTQQQRNYYGGSISITPTLAGVTKDPATMAAIFSASSGETIHVFGTGFEKNGQVYFDGTPGKIISWDATHIVVHIPEIKASTRKLIVQKANNVSVEMNFSVAHALTNDPLSAKQYYLDIIHAQDVWQYAQGAGVVVAVIDIGVNLNHEDLAGALWKNTKEIPNNGVDDDNNGYVDDYYGYNFGKNTAEILPSGDHGTMISGIISAQKDNAKGISGIAPKAMIMPLQIDITSQNVVNQVNKAIRYATDNGADIINMSFVTPGRTYVPFLENDYKDALQYAYAQNIVLVVAAGNGDVLGAGQNLNLNLFPQYPICNNRANGAEILLGVSALDIFGETLASFSSYGDTCVNIAAPGKDIISTSHPAYNNGELYATQDGTSFAAPQVAAAAALLKSYKRDMTNWEIIKILIKSADVLPDGSRRLNIKNAFDIISSSVVWSVAPVISSASYNAARSMLSLNGLYFKQGYRVNIERLSDRYSQSVTIDTLKNRTVLDIPIYFHLNKNESYAISMGNDTMRSNVFQLQTEGQEAIAQQPLADTTPVQQPAQSIQPTKPAPQPAPVYTPSRAGKALSKKLSGYIVLQVQQHGEAWYMYPKNKKRYYLGTKDDAFTIMRNLSIGVIHSFIVPNKIYALKYSGMILLDVQDHGKAYYIYPKDRKAYYLGTPDDAYTLMRTFGLGITDKDLMFVEPAE